MLAPQGHAERDSERASDETHREAGRGGGRGGELTLGSGVGREGDVSRAADDWWISRCRREAVYGEPGQTTDYRVRLQPAGSDYRQRGVRLQTAGSDCRQPGQTARYGLQRGVRLAAD